MNNTVAERFNVAGALVVKLFGSHDRERDLFSDRAGRVRDIGIKSAMYSRILFVGLGLVAAVGTADPVLYGSVADGTSSGSIDTRCSCRVRTGWSFDDRC